MTPNSLVIFLVFGTFLTVTLLFQLPALLLGLLLVPLDEYQSSLDEYQSDRGPGAMLAGQTKKVETD
jgi:hypothetical protein